MANLYGGILFPDNAMLSWLDGSGYFDLLHVRGTSTLGARSLGPSVALQSDTTSEPRCYGWRADHFEVDAAKTTARVGKIWPLLTCTMKNMRRRKVGLTMPQFNGDGISQQSVEIAYIFANKMHRDAVSRVSL